MLESFNSERKELRTVNQDSQNYIDSVKNERAEYPEQNTLYVKKVANITINSGSIDPQKKQNGKEEYFQENCKIPFDENEENKSIITIKAIEPNPSKTIEPNANETIEPPVRNKIEQISRKQK